MCSVPLVPQGVILYEGPSNFDGQPIAAIATDIRRPSNSSKTGEMMQVYVIRTDIDPVTAVKTGQDYSTCGNCPLRGECRAKRSCHVNVACLMPVYAAYRRGNYPKYDPKDHDQFFRERRVHFGTYGEIAAAGPYKLWSSLSEVVMGWTGYSHLWRESRFRGYRSLLTASAGSLDDAKLANSRGWRTIAVPSDSTRNLFKEVQCPGAAEREHFTNSKVCECCYGEGILLRPARKSNVCIREQDNPEKSSLSVL